jgi:adenosylhomocysteinase
MARPDALTGDQAGGPVARIEWVRDSCRLLGAIATEFGRTRPFDGLTIGTGIHLEPKTVALLLTLAAGGATVVSTGNLSSTQPGAVAYLRTHGVEVIGERTTDPAEHDRYLRQVLARQPDLLLDNGGDLFARYLEAPYPSLLGGTEETTSGRMRLRPLAPQLARPVLVINDSPTNGRQVTVFGYGACGQGVAATFRSAHAQVSVVEVDPVARLRASLDGFAVPDRAEALRRADIVLTMTGAASVVTEADLDLLRDDVILLNVGHFPREITVDAIAASSQVAEQAESGEGVTTFRLTDGRRIHLLTGGHMVNLSGPRPLGNSIESMDLGFALQSRCLEAVARHAVGAESVVVPVPRSIDEAVATAYLELYEHSG